jgi:hypothetical protein
MTHDCLNCEPLPAGTHYTETVRGGRRLTGSRECRASISGDCLNVTEGFEPCDTEDGECIHGGVPAGCGVAEGDERD